jgi:RNA polymerase sigma-70 factor (sigma-E family)
MADRARGLAVASASDDALSDLYAAHWVALVRLAYLLVRDQGRAEEVVQDAFIAAYPRLAGLRASGTALAYLRRAVVNRCRSDFRHRKVQERYLAAVREPSPDDSAENVVLRRGADLAMLQVLQRLPQRQREVLVLRYYADLSEQQIADTLEISTGSVKAHAHRALAALRREFGETS